jgi:hypothetical protein
MKKIILYSFIFVIVIFISSCGGSSGGSYGDDIEFSFVPNVPPNVIYVQEGSNDIPFEVIVEIKNRGGFPKDDIKVTGNLYLTGFDKSVISGDWDGGQSKFILPIGSSSSFPEGGITQKSYLANNINYGFKVQEYPMPLMLTACYYYETFASGITCIDPDPTSADQGQDVCQIGNVPLDAQHGPVKVTGVSQTANSKESIFTITISNTGSGEVLRQPSQTRGVISENKCLNLEFGDKDVVDLDAEIVGLGEGNCKPSGSDDDPIRLFNGQGTVVCRFPNDPSTTSAYTTPLQLTLKYGYLKTLSKEILLVNTGN